MPEEVDPISLTGWLLRGAIREDDYLEPDNGQPLDDPYNGSRLPASIYDNRPLHHFYDPVKDRPLTTILGIPLGKRAPDWALGSSDMFAQPNVPESNRRNHFTVFDAHEAMYRALTGKNQDGNDDTYAQTSDGRNKYWATVFRALGDVVHLVQDMAQPQHTRNDAHAGLKFDENGGFLGLKGHKSVYESYIEARATGSQFTTVDLVNPSVSTFTLIPTLLVYGNYPAPRFTDYRSFFTTRQPDGGDNILSRRGLADFSNRSFFSAGKNADNLEYQYPFVFLSGELQDLTTDWQNKPLPEGAEVELLMGNLPDVPGPIPLTTNGMFDQFLQPVGKRQYSLTRNNYDAMADLLIPRAVAYSSGLIDYFFRGKLEVQDAGFTAQGIVLRVKNAIDPKTQDYWKDEILFAGGNFVVTLQYKVPDSSDPSGFVTKFHTSDAARLNEDIKPSHASRGVFTFPGLPDVPDNAVNPEYRLVYRGKMGQESDAIAVATFTPVSGFVIAPDYAPADSVSGSKENRLVYRTASASDGGDSGWRLSKQKSIVAGNIDWKGWYQASKPTKVLSWVGPQARYFPDKETCENYQAKDGSYVCLFKSWSNTGNSIYEGGSTFAVAPGTVLGAAVTRDTDGIDWLIAIVGKDGQDVIYRRPFKRNTSADMYDPATNPDGWEKIGSYNAKANDNADKITNDADIPWFFNGDGTKAQTMRRWWDTSGNTPIQQLNRLELVIDAAVIHATVTPRGNNTGSITQSCSANYDADGAGSTQKTLNNAGQYIVAVDYKDNDERKATVTWNGVSSTQTSVQVQKETNPDTNVTSVVATDGNSTTDDKFLETLQWGSGSVDLTNDDLHITNTWHTGKPQTTYSHDEKEDYFNNEIVYYLDLRHDFFSYYQQGWHQEESFSKTDGAVTNASGGGTYNEKHRIRSSVGIGGVSELPAFDGGYSYTYDVDTQEDYQTTCPAGNTQSQTQSISYNFGWNWDKPVGGWAVDSQNNVALSQEIYGDAGYSQKSPYRFLTDSDLATVIPGNAGANPRYYPIGLVR